MQSYYIKLIKPITLKVYFLHSNLQHLKNKTEWIIAKSACIFFYE